MRRLTAAATNGPKAIRFAEGIDVSLYPYQKWLLRHGLELLPNGLYRFLTLIVLIARQNGKTTVLQVLTLWKLLEDAATMALGTSTNMEYAREAWLKTVELADRHDERVIAEQRDVDRWVRSAKYGALDTSLTLLNGARYKIASASRTGGRSLSVDLGIADELREHRPKGENDGWEAWGALSGTTTARPNSQIWGLSNQGDRMSVVLNHFRELGIRFIETGEGDPRLGLFEWSGEDECEIDDRQAWAQANPSLGYGGVTEATLESKMLTLPPEVFRTEHLCQGVPRLNSAIDRAAWLAGEDRAGTLDKLRARVALGVQVAQEGAHVSLVAAATMADGRTRVEVVAAWGSAEEARTDTPESPSVFTWIRRVRPRLVGWLPTGPGIVLDGELTRAFPEGAGRIRGRRLVGGQVLAAAQGLAEQIDAGRVLHPGDPLLSSQVLAAGRQASGDGWRFARQDGGNVDAVEAMSVAVHLARQMPRRAKPQLVYVP